MLFNVVRQPAHALYNEPRSHALENDLLTQSSSSSGRTRLQEIIDSKHAAKTKTSTVVIVLILIVAVGFATGYVTYSSSNGIKLCGTPGCNTTTTTAQGPPLTNNGASLPLYITASDRYAGGGAAGVVSIYQNGVNVTGCTLSGGACLAPGISVYPGEQGLYARYAYSNNLYWTPITIPSSSSLQDSFTVYAVQLSAFTLGTFTMAYSDQLGNAYVSGTGSTSCFNMTAYHSEGTNCGTASIQYSHPGVSPSNLFITVSNSVSNTGYVSSYDPIDNIQLSSFLVISGAGAASISGCSVTGQRGSTFYCFINLQDSQLTCQTIGQTLTCGSAKPSVTISAGTVAHSSTETETINIVNYGNINNFLSLGTYGPNAIVSNSQTIKVAK